MLIIIRLAWRALLKTCLISSQPCFQMFVTSHTQTKASLHANLTRRCTALSIVCAAAQPLCTSSWLPQRPQHIWHQRYISRGQGVGPRCELQGSKGRKGGWQFLPMFHEGKAGTPPKVSSCVMSAPAHLFCADPRNRLPLLAVRLPVPLPASCTHGGS